MCLTRCRAQWIAFIPLFVGSLALAEPSLYERRERIRSMEKKLSPETVQRKARSEAVLTNEGVPINQYLPVIEAEKEVKRRPTEEIAYRALALLVVAVKAEGLDQATVDKIAKDYGLTSHFTPKERAFLRGSLSAAGYKP
jgi:hypothetical protein